jgi:disulfide bond formation protein DsbB
MRLAIAFRTATHHNMMLDPCVLCAFSRFVITALIILIDTIQPRRFLIRAYCTIGAKVYPPFLP